MNLTAIAGVPSKSDVKPGMAYFAGTGPAGTTCGGCIHRGCMRQSRKSYWNEALGQSISKTYRTQGCAMFKKMSGKYGPPVDAANESCKYYERKSK